MTDMLRSELCSLVMFVIEICEIALFLLEKDW